MAFKPVRLTDPKGNNPDVIADNAIDLNNFTFRDGYVKAKSQAGVGKVESDNAKAAANGGGKATGADGKTVATA
jgi:hypothetical protein